MDELDSLLPFDLVGKFAYMLDLPILSVKKLLVKMEGQRQT